MTPAGALDWLPPADSPLWEARYANDLEAGKRTARDLAALPAWVRGVFAALTAPAFVAELSAAFGIPDLEPDPTMHGGGLHATEPGGWLNCHLDYARHPHLPDRERRLNAIVFLHPAWEPAWGGTLDLCDPGGGPVARLAPRPGRLAVFETGDESYHAVAPVGAAAAPRVSAAVYYLTPARPGVTRRRALFMPTRR